MQGVTIDGTHSKLSISIQIAQLTLKHRENKNQRQRIVVFIGSPIVEDTDALVKLGKKLKKNNVSVDVVSFGCDDENQEKLEAFHAAVNSGESSHLVTVPAGTILSDMLFATPIFMEEGASGGGEGGAPVRQSHVVDGFDYGELGVDPALDPELAMALRMSVEEERARVAREQQQEAAANAAGGEGNEGGDGNEGAVANQHQQDNASQEAAEQQAPMEMDEDALLQQALALSMQGAVADNPPSTAINDDMMMMDGIDDPELQQALALSMQMTEEEAATAKKEDDNEENKD
jgi:26S proteasome regulatory subunit N10